MNTNPTQNSGTVEDAYVNAVHNLGDQGASMELADIASVEANAAIADGYSNLQANDDPNAVAAGQPDIETACSEWPTLANLPSPPSPAG